MGVFGDPGRRMRTTPCAPCERQRRCARRSPCLRGELRRERGIEFGGAHRGQHGRGRHRREPELGATSRRATSSTSRRGSSRRRVPGDILLGRDTVQPRPSRGGGRAGRPVDGQGQARGGSRPTASLGGRNRTRAGDLSARGHRWSAASASGGALLDTFHQAVADRSCHLFTVLGAAGVGKSRLVAEVLETIDGAATVAVGPLPALRRWVDVVATGRGSRRHGAAGACRARRRGRRRARLRAARVRRASPSRTTTRAGPCARCSRPSADERPLVLVVDDLQWAEPTFVDVIEHVADWARDVAAAVADHGASRAARRSAWAGAAASRTRPRCCWSRSARRRPATCCGTCWARPRLADRAVARILDVAEGNPLYVEEIVAMLTDQGLLDAPDGDMSDRGAADDPRAAGRAARPAAGRRARGDRGGSRRGQGVRARAGARCSSTSRCATGSTDTCSRSFAPTSSGRQRTSDGAFRFRHQLIRDAAYEGIPKQHARRAARALCRLARGAPAAISRRSTSCSATTSSAPSSCVASSARARRRTTGMAARASASLARAGRRAAAREEPAATRLLERAAALASDAERPPILVDLAGALESDGELLRGAAIAGEALQLARIARDRRTAARARLAELSITMGHTESDLRHRRPSRQRSSR